MLIPAPTPCPLKLVESNHKLARINVFGAWYVAPLFCLALASTFLHVFWTNEFSALAIFALCAAGGIIVSTSLLEAAPTERSFTMRLFTLYYSLNVLLVFAFYYYYAADHGTPFLATELNPHDDAHFHHIGTTIARDWIESTARSQVLLKDYTYKGYPWLLGGIYYFANLWGDMSPIAPRIVNAMCGGLLTVAVFVLAKLVYNPTVAVRASIISAFFPTFWLYSGNTIRDIIIALLVTMSVVIVLKLRHGSVGVSSFMSLSGFVLCLFAIFLLRSSTFFALLAAFLLYFVTCLKGFLARALLVGVTVVLLTIGLFYGKEFGAPPPDSLLQQSDHYTETIVAGSSKESLAIQYIYKAPPYLFVPLNAVYTAFAPIPPIKSFYLPHIIEGIGAVVWYFYIPFWVIGMYYGLRNRQSMLLVLVTLVLFMAVATIVASARHKTQFQGLALVHVAEASIRLTGRTVSINIVVSLILCALAAVYMLLKF